MNLVASDEEVDAKLAEMKAPYTQEEFDKRLQAASMSLADLRLQYPPQSYVRKVYEQGSELAHQHHRCGRHQFL